MREHGWLSAETHESPPSGDEHTNSGAANVFVQWKGTDACFDFTCDCGYGGHYDGFFAYYIRCPKCSQVWGMPSTVYPVKLADAQVEGCTTVEPN